MKVNMDGLRNNLANAYEKTIRAYRKIIREHNEEEFLDLKEGLDDLRHMIASLMCCYSDNPGELMTDMGEEADRLLFANPEDNED